MRPLVVFYSRTGITKRVGEALAQMLGCDYEQLVDTKKRGGPVGFAGGARDAQAKNLTTLGDVTHDPAHYDVVILGTPIWSFSLSPAVRTYIATYASKFEQVAFFSTQGLPADQALFSEMEALCEKRPVATLALHQREVKKGAYQEKLRAFADGLQART